MSLSRVVMVMKFASANAASKRRATVIPASIWPVTPCQTAMSSRKGSRIFSAWTAARAKDGPPVSVSPTTPASASASAPGDYSANSPTVVTDRAASLTPAGTRWAQVSTGEVREIILLPPIVHLVFELA